MQIGKTYSSVNGLYRISLGYSFEIPRYVIYKKFERLSFFRKRKIITWKEVDMIFVLVKDKSGFDEAFYKALNLANLLEKQDLDK